MVVLRALRAILVSRWLWTLIGLVLLSLLIWVFGPIITIGASAPLASETARLGVVAGLLVVWLVWLILRQRRAIRANRLFVSELAAPAEKPLSPGEEGVAAINAKFQQVLGELRRRKLGGKRFLREMPWYEIGRAHV